MKNVSKNQLAFLFCKFLILCSVLFGGIMQHCTAMNKSPVTYYTIDGGKLNAYPISWLLENYEKKGNIGSGSDGKVILMQNKKNKNYIALKKSSCRTILDEAFFLKMLHGDENIIQMFEVCYKDKKYKNQIRRKHFLVLEYAEGGSLSKMIKTKNQNIAEYEIREYAKQILAALLTLNKMHILHLDIKPRNIVLTKDNKIKLIDFGSAATCKDKYIDKKTLNFEQDLMKEFNYTAPELDKDCPYALGPKADLWSFGYLLYCLVVGKTKLDLSFNESRTEITIPFDEPEWELVSEQLKNLIKKLMVCNPDDRPSIEKVANHPWFAQH